jgi:glucans biosynthesis protein
MLRRRAILKSAMALAAARLAYPRFAAAAPPGTAPGAVPVPAAAPPAPQSIQPFDYAWLKGQAHKLAGNPFLPSQDVQPPAMAKLSYDQFQSLRFRADHALWGNAGLEFRLQFFHVGRTFTEAVRLYEIVDGQAREIVYDPAMFEFDKAGIDPKLMRDHVGFAGFRVQFVTDWRDDVAAFLGASYFRAVGGDTRQYGLSARALAVDTAFPRPEEFPRFTSFWFERPQKDSGTLTIYALMDSPSIAGALRFQLVPGGTMVMDIDSALYPRKPIERLGVAPLTSMFFYGENDRRGANDWRPEIHDSDGLSMWTGAGEWIWRPLTNPGQLHFSSLLDENPRGFGLLQRDRNFDHYQDDGVYYDRRPSLWVEPKPGGWGKGSVQLVEIPTVDETFDNIVAFWNPAEKPKAGQELLFGYRLHWGTHMPYASPLADHRDAHRHRRHRRPQAPVLLLALRGGLRRRRAGRSPPGHACRGGDHHLARSGRACDRALRRGISRLPRAVRCAAAGRWVRAHRHAFVPARRRPGADGNVDLFVDAAVGEGTQGSTELTAGDASRRPRQPVAPSTTTCWRPETTTPPGFSTVTANALADNTGSAARIGTSTSVAFTGMSKTPPSTG